MAISLATGCIDYSGSYKAVDLAEAPPGATLTYTLYGINSGDEASTSTIVQDVVSTNLENVANITGGGVYESATRTVTWNLGTVAAGGSFTLTFTADILSTVAVGTEVQNTASITYTGQGPQYSNTVSTTVIPPDPDHFEFAAITSPQEIDQPFEVTIYAKDSAGQTQESFEGAADLQDLSGAITPTVTLNEYTAIDAGVQHGLSINENGSLQGWGLNDQGQTNVPAGDDFIAISAGGYHNLAIRSDGTLTGWGYNNQGQATPPAGNNFTAVAAGGYHSLALKSDGLLVGWGENSYGQATVPSGNDFVAISAGYYHSLALKSDGTLVGWGCNNYGQATVPSGDDYIAVSTGAYHSLALKDDGSIVGWGFNDHGESTPPTSGDYTAISAGNYHSLALKDDGTLAAWGYNCYGQTDVPAGSDYIAIAAGDHHCLAMHEDGTLVGWGYNGYGQTDVPAGIGFVAGVFTGMVTIGSPYSSNVITASYNGKTGSSNAFDVTAPGPDFSTSYKQVDASEVMPEGTLNYSVHLENTGDGQATQTTVMDNLDSNLENISGITGDGVYNPSTHQIVWSLGTIGSQEQRELAFSAQVKASTVPGTVIGNQVSVECAEIAPFVTDAAQSTVISGALDHFEFSTVPTVTAGEEFAITITAKDDAGNTVISFNDSCTLDNTTQTISPAQTSYFVNGVLTIEDVTITEAAESDKITASCDGVDGESNTFVVQASALDHFVFDQIAFPQEAGIPITITIAAQDYWNNPCSFDGSCTLDNTTHTITPIQTPNFVDGMITFDVTITGVTDADIITASYDGKTGQSNSFVVGPMAVHHFEVSAPESAEAGVAFPVTVTAKRSTGVIATFYEGTCSLISQPNNISLGVTLPFTEGVVTQEVTIFDADPARTIEATSGSITGTSPLFEVVHTELNSLTFSNISSPQDIYVPFSVTVTAMDTYGNLFTSLNDSFTLNDETDSLSCIPASPSFCAGEATFEATITKSSATDSISAIYEGATGTASGISNTFTVDPADSDHLTFDNIGTQTAGTVFAVTITARDTYGNPVTGLNGDCTLTDLTGLMTYTPVLMQDGIAVVENVAITEAGNNRITAVCTDESGTYTGTSNDFEVVSAEVDHFTFNTIPTQTAGTPFEVTITAWDEHGNMATNFAGQCSLSTNPGEIELGSITFDGGTATAEDLVIKEADPSRTIIVSYEEASGTISSSSDPFAVSPAPLDHLDIVGIDSEPISSQIAGDPFTITVTARDEYDNTVTGAAGTCDLDDRTFSLDDGSDGDGPVSVLLENGTATLDVSVDIAYFGDLITANYEYEGNTYTGKSDVFDVAPGALFEFTFDTIAPQTAGETFTVTVTARDINGNVAYGQTVAPTLSDTTYTISPTETVLSSLGVFTQDVSINKAGDDISISATSGSVITASEPFTVKSAAVHHFTLTGIDSQPIGLQVAGAEFPVVITAWDAFDNPVTDYDGRVLLTCSEVAGIISPDSVTGFDAGQATINASYSQDGTISIIATDYQDAGITGQSNEFTVAPAAVGTILVEPAYAMVGCGDTLDFNAQAWDSNGDPISQAYFSWAVEGGVGSIDADGLFTGSTLGAGTVTATLGDNSTSVAVSVVTLIDSIPAAGVTNLSASQNPIVIDGWLTIASEATLNIGEGAVVKFMDQDSGIGCGGDLIVAGTSTSGVTFTSIYDDDVPYNGNLINDTGADGDTDGMLGDWTGIQVTGTCDLDYLTINFAGFGESPAVDVTGSASADVAHCSISTNLNAGLRLHDSAAQAIACAITGNSTGILVSNSTSNNIEIGGSEPAQANTITGNSGPGIQVGTQSTNIIIQGNDISANGAEGILLDNPEEGQTISQVTIDGNDIDSNSGSAIYVGANDSNASLVKNNQGSGNGLNAICVTDLRANTTWDASNIGETGEELSWLIYASIDRAYTEPYASLTLETGTVVKLQPGMNLGIRGFLSNGTEAEKVYLTSVYDDHVGGNTSIDGPSSPSRGDWGLFQCVGQGDVSIGNVDIGYGGVDIGGIGDMSKMFSVSTNGGKISVSGCRIHDSGSCGVAISGGDIDLSACDITSNGTTIQSIDPEGISLEDPNALPMILDPFINIGAILISETVSVTNSVFSGNSIGLFAGAAISGSSITIADSKATITGNDFTENMVGAVVMATEASISDNDFVDNFKRIGIEGYFAADAGISLLAMVGSDADPMSQYKIFSNRISRVAPEDPEAGLLSAGIAVLGVADVNIDGEARILVQNNSVSGTACGIATMGNGLDDVLTAIDPTSTLDLNDAILELDSNIVSDNMLGLAAMGGELRITDNTTLSCQVPFMVGKVGENHAKLKELSGNQGQGSFINGFCMTGTEIDMDRLEAQASADSGIDLPFVNVGVGIFGEGISAGLEGQSEEMPLDIFLSLFEGGLRTAPDRTVAIASDVVVKSIGASFTISGDVVFETDTETGAGPCFTSLFDDSVMPGTLGELELPGFGEMGDLLQTVLDAQVPAAGDWTGIVAEAAASPVTVNGCRIAYADTALESSASSTTVNDVNIDSCVAGIYAHSNLSATSNTLTLAGGEGIRAESITASTVTGNSISSFVSKGTAAGIHLVGTDPDASSATVNGNQVAGMGGEAILLDTVTPHVTGNDMTSNGKGLHLKNCLISDMSDIDTNVETDSTKLKGLIIDSSCFKRTVNALVVSPLANGLPYIFEGENILEELTTMQMVPGAEQTLVVKFDHESRLVVQGALEADGGADKKVVFTSLKDDDADGIDSNCDEDASSALPQDWPGIVAEEGSGPISLNGCRIAYAGTALESSASSTTLSNAKIDSCVAGIYAHTNLNATRNILTIAGGEGIRAEGITSSYIAGNSISSSVNDGTAAGIHIVGIHQNTCSATVNGNRVTGMGGEAILLDKVTPHAMGNVMISNGMSLHFKSCLISNMIDITANAESGSKKLKGMIIDGSFFERAGGTIYLNPLSNGMPYIFQGINTLLEGTTMEINPAKTPKLVIKFGPGASFETYGHLLALGGDQNNIVFTSVRDDDVDNVDSNCDGSDSSAARGDWYEISAGYRSDLYNEVDLEHCVISFATTGLYVAGGDARASYCKIHDCVKGIDDNNTGQTGQTQVSDNEIWECRGPEGESSAIKLDGKGNMEAVGNKCYGNDYGITLLGTDNGNPSARSNELCNNGTGIYGVNLNSLSSISSNRVYDNDIGISILNSDCTISQNVIGRYYQQPSSQTGLLLLGSQRDSATIHPTITKNVIQFNAVGIQVGDGQLGNDCYPYIFQNAIFRNSNCGVLAKCAGQDSSDRFIALANGTKGNDIAEHVEDPLDGVDTYAVKNEGTTTVSAYNCFWGTNNPVFGDASTHSRVSGGVDTYPIAGSSCWDDMLQEEKDLGYDNYSGFDGSTNTATGNLVKTYTDFDIPALGLPMKLTRTYNSRAHNRHGGFGYGWSFSFGVKLDIIKTGTDEDEDANRLEIAVNATWEDGKVDTYTWLNYANRYEPPLGCTDELIKETDGTYTLITQSKQIYKFSDKGKIKYMATPNSDINNPDTLVRFIYPNQDQPDEGELLSQVIFPCTTGGTPRTLFFQWDQVSVENEKPVFAIKQVNDSQGMYCTYYYDTGREGNLVRVNYANTGIDNANIYDSPCYIEYTYTSGHLISAISQPVNQTETQQDATVLESYEYKPNTSMLENVKANGGALRTHYAYGQPIEGSSETYTLITDYLEGDDCLVRKHYSDSLGRLVKEESIYSDGITEPATTTYSYDLDGHACLITDPAGAKSSMTHSDGLLLEKKDPRGTDPNGSFDVHTYNYLPANDPVATRNLVRDECYSLNGTDMFYNRYSYDEKGNLACTEYGIKSADYDRVNYNFAISQAGLRKVVNSDFNFMGQPQTVTESVMTKIQSEPDVYAYVVSKITTYGYTAQGDKAWEKVTDGSTQQVVCSWVEYEYDAQGRLTYEKKKQDGNSGDNWQERKLHYSNVGVSRQKPVREYISQRTDGATKYWEGKTTSFFNDGQVELETLGELFTGIAIDSSPVDNTRRLETSYSYYTDGQAPKLLEKTVTGITSIKTDGSFNTGELERTRYRWHCNGLAKEECQMIGDSEVNKTTHDYDDLGRETAKHEVITRYNESGSPFTGTFDTEYAYDAAGNKTLDQPMGSGSGTVKVYDLAKKVITETDGSGAVKNYTYDLAGNKSSETIVKNEGVNITTNYTYDAISRQTSEVRPNPEEPDHPIETKYTYGAGIKTAETSAPDANDNALRTIDYTYDPAERLLTESKHYESGLAVTTHTYDWCGNETSVTEPGQATKYKTYDRAGRLLKTYAGGINLGGSATSAMVVMEEYSYDGAGRKLTSKAPYGSDRDWEGAVATTLYDGLGRELRVSVPTTQGTAVTNHAWSKSVVGSSAMLVHQVTSPLNLVTTTHQDQHGRDISVSSDGGSGDIRVKYTVITEPINSGRTEIICGPASGNKTTNSYNGAGKVVATSDNAGGLIQKDYNERGLVISETEKIDNNVSSTLNHVYDDLGRETMTYKGEWVQGEPTDVTGREPHWNKYNVLGQKIREYDAGTVAYALNTVYTYNELDHLLTESRPVTDSTSIVKTYIRDEAGWVKDVKLAGESDTVQHTEYNTLGMVLSTTSYPEVDTGITYSYTWDAAGRMRTETDGEGSTWTYTYNVMGLLAELQDPLYDDTESDSYHYATYLEYDKEGHMTEKTVKKVDVPTGVTSSIVATYNLFGEMVTRDLDGDATPPPTEQYTYQADTGRLTGVSCNNGITLGYENFDNANRPKTIKYTIPDIGTKTETVTYKANGSLASITMPETGETTYTYDSKKHLAQVEDSSENIYSYQYYNTGLLESLTYPSSSNLSTAYTYTLDGRPDTLTLASSSTLAYLNYDYDAYGKVEQVQRTDAQADPSPSDTTTYSWDRIGRLITADSLNAGWDETYTYDARSNLKTKNKGTIIDEDGNMDSETVTSTGFLHDDDGHIKTETVNGASTTYTYDQAGRLITMAGAKNATYEWDGADHLVWANENGADVSYLYDSSGRMLYRTQTEEEIDTYSAFLPYGASQEAGEVYEWGEGGSVALKYSYVSDSSGTRLAQTDALANATTYPFRDPRGDVLDLASTAGTIAATYAYTPFGELQDGFAQFQGANKETGTPFLYQDDYLDPATELYQMQARWYDPSTARFLSLDPKMGDASDPLRRLPYTYCADDPVFNSDPTGASFASSFQDFIYALAITSAGSSGGNSNGSGNSREGSLGRRRYNNRGWIGLRSTISAKETPENFGNLCSNNKIEEGSIEEIALKNRRLDKYLDATSNMGISEDERVEIWRGVRKNNDLFYTELTFEADGSSSSGTLTQGLYINLPFKIPFIGSHLENPEYRKATVVSGQKGRSENQVGGPTPRGAFEIIDKQTVGTYDQEKFGAFCYRLRATTRDTIRSMDKNGRTLFTDSSAWNDIGNVCIHVDQNRDVKGGEGTLGCVGFMPDEPEWNFTDSAKMMGVPNQEDYTTYSSTNYSKHPTYLFVNYPGTDEYTRPY